MTAMMPSLPHVEAKELFIQEIERIYGKISVELDIEQLLNYGYFRTKFKGVTFFTDVGLIDGDFKVFTFANGICNRISSYQENSPYDFSFVESKIHNCKKMISFLDKQVKKDPLKNIWLITR